jgi:hypothetical protein
MYDGVVNMDLITERTLLGHVFGGIAAEQANDGATAASNQLFEVWYSPVPEPASAGLILALTAVALVGWKRRLR